MGTCIFLKRSERHEFPQLIPNIIILLSLEIPQIQKVYKERKEMSKLWLSLQAYFDILMRSSSESGFSDMTKTSYFKKQCFILSLHAQKRFTQIISRYSVFVRIWRAGRVDIQCVALCLIYSEVYKPHSKRMYFPSFLPCES